MAGIVLDRVAKVYGGNVRAVDCGDLILFALIDKAFVRASNDDGEVVAELGPEDVMYVPHGSTYDVCNIGSETCRLVFGVAPTFLP
jgi:hypothetical protein